MGARKVLGTAMVAVGVAAVLLASPRIVEQERAVSSYAKLAEEAGPRDGDDIDWDALLSASPSVVAWCYVEGTSIDLPVCQATDDDPLFWLSHDIWGSESPAGTPYVDHRATAASEHILCYGHHLAGTGGMFSELYRCHEQGEFDRVLSGGLLWSTPDGTAVRMEPLCASVVDMEDQHLQRFAFEDDVEFRAWLQGTLDLSTARHAGAEALVQDATRAITLVTCSSDLAGQPGRTVVTFVA